MGEGKISRVLRIRWSAINATGKIDLSEYFRYVVETAWDWGATTGLGWSPAS